MSWIDLALVAIIIVAVVGGLRRGFLRGALDLLTIVLAIVIASLFYHVVGKVLARWVELQAPLLNLVAFTGLALLTLMLTWSLLILPLAPFIDIARRVPISRQVDTLLGAIPGLAKGAAFAATMLLASTLLPLGTGYDATLARSPLAQRTLRVTSALSTGAEQRVGFDLADFTSLNTAESEAPRRLPHAYTVGLSVSPTDENRMLQLLNQERVSRGLQPLQPDPRLQAVARAHSEEMLREGYFAHDSPEHGTPSDRLDAAGISFEVAGENLAYAPTVEIAHRGLMNSPGHRANILAPDFTRVGIGVILAPNGERMFTQDFIGN